ncbi:MAG: class I SAM-dependent methyltransferase [Paracoccaceae bacterium]
MAHHYDLPDQLYDLFLDGDRQYSCAYFQSEGDDLAVAQAAKKRHLAAKLLLEPGQKILDIGSGWGGLALYLAQAGGGEVTGLTLSQSQLNVARARAAEAGADDKVNFQLRDYREEKGTFDRIVSVGMFEHVGVNQYQKFFSTVDDLLSDDGVCVLHSISRMSGPGSTSPWVRKYIFPGGYSPSLSETLAVIEKSGLWVTDIEVLRLHYADTLHAWRSRFEANRARVAEMMDERFCRMWEYYLVLAESAFRHGDHFVFQIQLAKHRDTVPLTRDYIHDWENSHPVQVVRRKPQQVA